MATGRPNGRPPKPVEKKRAEGNKGHKKLPEKKYQEDKITRDNLPKPPSHFKTETIDMWNRIWLGGSKWLKIDRDFISIQLFCDAWEEYSYLRRMLKLGSQAGGVDRVINTEKGYPVQHPYVSQLKQAKVDINTQMSSLGFTPSDFARLQISEMNAEETEFIKNLLTSSRSR